MQLKYNICTLTNAEGKGESRQYVRLMQDEHITEKQLLRKIQDRTSLTRGEVAAVLSELRDLAIHEFQMGHRFYMPGIGYFSLSASLEIPEESLDKKITGKEVRISGINFRPETGFLQDVQQDIRFIRSHKKSASIHYTEESILARIKEYLQTHRYITSRIMQTEFGLTRYTAQKWITYFCEKGIMVKEGKRGVYTYFLAAEEKE